MKNYPKLLILIFIILPACREDERDPALSGTDLLIWYDWITYTVERPDFQGEPDMIFAVWSFTESDFATGDFTGAFYEHGNWTLEDNVLTIGGEEIIILELNEENLVYEDRQGTIITRLPVAKIDR